MWNRYKYLYNKYTNIVYINDSPGFLYEHPFISKNIKTINLDAESYGMTDDHIDHILTLLDIDIMLGGECMY